MSENSGVEVDDDGRRRNENGYVIHPNRHGSPLSSAGEWFRFFGGLSVMVGVVMFSPLVLAIGCVCIWYGYRRKARAKR